MRDKNRIPEFTGKYAELWMNAAPDQRFGQFTINFFNWIIKTYGVDPFFPEEEKMLTYMQDYCKSVYGLGAVE